MPLKRKFTDEFHDDFRPIKTRPSIHGIKEPDPDDSTSSVGSNNPIYELEIIPDDHDDEVQSPPFKVDNGDDDDAVKPPPSMVDDVSHDSRWRETEKKVNEDEDADWWVKYGSMIVDDNGFLLGEFRRLDEDLYTNIMMIR